VDDVGLTKKLSDLEVDEKQLLTGYSTMNPASFAKSRRGGTKIGLLSELSSMS
jgi:hypothetical protein